MGSGDIVVGKDQANFKPRQSIVKNHAENAGGPRPGPAKPPQQQMCGAMDQQGADNRAASQPQEFVRLVGCRDPKVGPPSVR